MRIYEYGKENPEIILLIHPSLVTWDYFENVIPLLEQHYHLLIPALPGYDLKDNSEFSSIEKIASRERQFGIQFDREDCVPVGG